MVEKVRVCLTVLPGAPLESRQAVRLRLWTSIPQAISWTTFMGALLRPIGRVGVGGMWSLTRVLPAGAGATIGGAPRRPDYALRRARSTGLGSDITRHDGASQC